MPIITNKYFVFPFATTGVVAPVPDPTDPGGTVTYEQGYGDRYTRDLLTDPLALAYPEPESNQICNDITGALKQYQEWGVPNFIESSQNYPVGPFPYDLYAYALYEISSVPVINQSLVMNNTAVPTDRTKWGLRDVMAEKVAYDNQIFQTGVVDGDIVYWNQGIAKFDLAVANGTVAQNVVGVADVTNARVLGMGKINIITGLTPGAIYYLSTSVPGEMTATLPSNFVNELGVAQTSSIFFFQNTGQTASSFITGMGMEWFTNTAPPGWLLQDGSAISRTTYANLFAVIGTDWGAGDGSTTFNVPNKANRTGIGAGTLVINNIFTADAGTNELTFSNVANNFYTGTPFTVSNSGGALPAPLAAATTYYAVVTGASTIKVATTLANALEPFGAVTIDLTTAGTGINTITLTSPARVLAEYGGESAHSQTSIEVGPHYHPDGGFANTSSGSGHDTTQPSPTGIAGDGAAMNIMQPYIVHYYIIKT